ncbi:hypothetical protein NERG_01927 [Nematocida ausubeli]|uniref:ER lumen protein-retaining receptor n=1 Tax=Nematocida ausubeli (strain ATCC PRA-371 / ERTm2) TaxID=1913371 RepID=H8ZEA6_NEMA1|nr:hypothetical protein NERG_01927 [Nematocida ausubeli]KAI5132878.1 ER lumen protein retaining receptor [Nematocida ausubeli]
MPTLLSTCEILLRTFADLLHLLAMLILLVKMNRTKSCSGISLKSQLLYLSVYLFRYIDIIYIVIYPVLLRSRRLVYNSIMKVLFVLLQSKIIYKVNYKYSYTYDRELDNLNIALPIGMALVISMLINKSYGFHYKIIIELFWSSSIVLESIAIIPQLLLLYKTGEVEVLTIEYIVLLGFYRAIYMAIWLVKYIITRENTLLLCGSIIQSILYGELFWVYGRRVKSRIMEIKRIGKEGMRKEGIRFIRDAFV